MAEQTLLQLCQNAALKLGTPFPTVVTTSGDTTIAEMWQCLNEEVQDQANREYDFPQLRVDTTFSYSTNANYQALQMSAVPALRSIIPGTLWNRTTRIACVGPITDPEWAQMIALGVSGSLDYYRMAGGWLLLYPGHTAANTYGYTYQSRYAVLDTNGTTTKELFVADTDTTLLPSRIVRAGLEWRWKRIKRMPYAEELRMYEDMLQNEANRAPLPGPVTMDNVGAIDGVGPGLLIAAGSWPL